MQLERCTETGIARFRNLTPTVADVAYLTFFTFGASRGTLLRLTNVRDQIFLALDVVRARSYSLVVRYSPEHKAQNHENILSVAAPGARRGQQWHWHSYEEGGPNERGLLPAF
jgi:hypothetical protein